MFVKNCFQPDTLTVALNKFLLSKAGIATLAMLSSLSPARDEVDENEKKEPKKNRTKKQIKIWIF